MSAATPFRLLALDGGGVRRILGVVLLARMERYLGRPLHEAVDLVIGTSAGAIAGCCLSMGMPAAEIAGRWEEFARAFFPSPRRLQDYARRLASLTGAVPKYADAAIDGGLQALFGERALGELLIPHTLTVAFDPGATQVLVFRSSDPEHAVIPMWQGGDRRPPPLTGAAPVRRGLRRQRGAVAAPHRRAPGGMKRLRVGILDLVYADAPDRSHWLAPLRPQFAGIMPQAVAVWARQGGHRVHYAVYYDPNFGVRFEVLLAALEGLDPAECNPYVIQSSLSVLRPGRL